MDETTAAAGFRPYVDDGPVAATPSREGTVAFAVEQLDSVMTRVEKTVSEFAELLLPILGDGGEDVLHTGMPAMHDPAPVALGVMEQVARAHAAMDRLVMIRERLRLS